MAGTGSNVPCQHVGCTSWRCNSLNCSRVDPFGFRHADRVGELQEECLTPRSPPARNLPTPPAMLLPEMSRETIEMGQANMMYGNPLAAPQQFRPAHQPRPINGSPLRGLAQPAVVYLDIDQFQGAIQNLAEDVELPRTYALEEQMGTLQQRVTAIEQTHGQETIILKASKYDAMLARIRELEGRVAWYEERDRAQMPAAREEGQPSGIIKDELMG